MEKERSSTSKRVKWLTAIIASAVVLVEALAVALFIFIVTTPKLEDTTTIVVNGREVEDLDFEGMLIIPGKTQSYEVTLYNRLIDDYHILVEYTGSDDVLLYQYVEASIKSENCFLSKELDEVVNKGYQSIGYERLTKDEGVKFTVSYHFSSDITEELIRPFSLKLSFKIEH